MRCAGSLAAAMATTVIVSMPFCCSSVIAVNRNPRSYFPTKTDAWAPLAHLNRYPPPQIVDHYTQVTPRMHVGTYDSGSVKLPVLPLTVNRAKVLK